MLRLSKMINNTYKEFQARTSEKIADFGNQIDIETEVMQ